MVNKKLKKSDPHSQIQILHKKQTHIALVSNTSWSIFNFRIELIRSLIQRGFKVSTIAPRDEYSDKLTAAGASFIPLEISNYSTHPFYDLRTFYQLFRIYKSGKFDTIIHYTIKPNIYGGIAARLNKTAYYQIVTGLGRTFGFSKITQVIVNSLYKFSIKNAKEIWFLNDENRNKFVNEGLVQFEKTFVLPSEGINTNKFLRTTELKQNKITRFLFAGRLLKDKGILDYLEAAKVIVKKYPRVKFEIIGFTNIKNKNSITLHHLESWQQKGWINYLGSHEDIRPFINRSDCVVFPSYYEEGISRILLEASSMSTPIITTDQIGCRDVVRHDENGLLFPKKSVPDLIDAIEYFLDMPIEKRLEMGTKGRSFVKEFFDIRIVVNYYFKKIFSRVNESDQTDDSIGKEQNNDIALHSYDKSPDV